jgi:hypothetical protein
MAAGLTGIVSAALMLTGCSRHQGEHGPLVVTSPAFADQATIPIAYGCTGTDGSPPLAWHGSAPSGTRSWAIVMRDLDVTPQPWAQWVVSDIPVSTRTLAPSLVPAGAQVSAASNSTVGYVGACPPGGAVHRYQFTVYAEKVSPGLHPDTPAAVALPAIQAAALGSASLTGTFAR